MSGHAARSRTLRTKEAVELALTKIKRRPSPSLDGPMDSGDAYLAGYEHALRWVACQTTDEWLNSLLHQKGVKLT